MSLLKHALHHPSKALDDLSHDIADYSRRAARRPFLTGGVIFTLLVVLGFICLFPDLKRYIRMKRM